MSMDAFQTKITRRNWLRFSGLGAGSALSMGTLGNLLLPARSAQAGDYKALVCIFLYGGNDGFNCIVPTDNDRYSQYKTGRGSVALAQGSLLPMSGISYGLHPSLTGLQGLWDRKRLAPVFNVGTLRTPLTKAQYRDAPPQSPLVPMSLFAHSDQQSLWESAASSSAERTGWGGRAAAEMGTINPVISVGGNTRYGMSSVVAPLVLPGPGATFGAVELSTGGNRSIQPGLVARTNALRAMYQQTQNATLPNAYSAMQREAFAVADKLAAIVQAQPGTSSVNAGITSAFASLTSGGQITTSLGQQLFQIAKLIANNGTVQGNRQIFFAQLNGFDTHAGQGPVHISLLKQLGDAMAAFDNAMVNIGLGGAVTSFTQSDFGRTFASNGSLGTDHAWGNNHFIMGGAVSRATTYGTYPELTLGGPDDIGLSANQMQGRWIPTTSVDQYAATLLSWFGASNTQLDAILPNLHNFGSARSI